MFCPSRWFCVGIGVWDKVLGSVAERRAETGMLRLFPIYLKGEDLFGLTVSVVARIAESVNTPHLWMNNVCLLCPVLIFCDCILAAWHGGLFEVPFPLWTEPLVRTSSVHQPLGQCPV